MPIYMVEASWSLDAVKKFVHHPQNRTEVIREMVESLGGKLIGFWVSFGDQDVVTIAEMPDNISAAAMSATIAAGGALKNCKTTPLLTWAEAVKAFQKAESAHYIPVEA